MGHVKEYFAKPRRTYKTKLVITFLTLLLCAGFGNVQAQEPTFRNGLLTLPVVDRDGETWSLELALQDNSFPPEFELTYANEIFAPITMDTPWFLDDLLIIPELQIGRDSYWVELRLDSADLFVLDQYGINRQYQPGFGNRPSFHDWVRVPGEARDISVGADGTVWVLGANTYPDYDSSFFGDDDNTVDFGLYVLDEYGWLEVPGAGVRLDVDPDGYPWIVNSEHEIWRLSPFGWERIPGRAHDIGIGADGSVWVLGTTERRGGYEVFRYTGFGWQKVHGTGVRIDVDPYGIPWVINHDDEIFRLENGAWQELPGLAKDIGIGADGSVWVIGSNEREGGYGIYFWNSNYWEKVSGSARQISVGPDGSPWVVNRDGEIYTRW